MVAQAPSQEERILREEQARRLLKAVARLREADQEMLSLRYAAGLSKAEIGKEMGTSSNVVAARVHRALGRLEAAVRVCSREEGT